MQNLSKEVIKGIVNVAMGRQDKLFVPDLSVMINAHEVNEAAAFLWQQLGRWASNGSDMAGGSEAITMREFIRVLFAEIGIEIEFSGKDKHEKAVVLDTDADLSEQLGLATALLMPGQTLIRVGPSTQQI